MVLFPVWSRGAGQCRADPHQEFTGKNILYQAHPSRRRRVQFARPAEEVQAALTQAANKLLEARGARVRPHLDDKVLTAWNGLMISAFAKAGAVLAEPRYANAARRAADFIDEPHVRSSQRSPAAALPPGRRRHPRLPGRLRLLHPGAARSVRDRLRVARPGTGDPAHREDGGVVRRRRKRRILQHARAILAGDAHQGRLRWRGAFRQFRRRSEPAAARRR